MAVFNVDHGWYSAKHPIPVMHLEGSIEEVAEAHGALLRHIKPDITTVEFLADRIPQRLNTSAQLGPHPWLQSTVQWLYRKLIRAPILNHTPERYKIGYERFAEASGIDSETVLDALTVSDGALRAVSLFLGSDIAPLFPANFGCTSIVWNSGAASSLHGRTLDYEGAGVWDKNQIIMHIIPSEGLAHVSLTALGVHAPGITAFNEARLSIAVHQLALNNSQANGTPMPVISAEIMRNARTIDDAITIIRGFPRAGSWAYVLSQGTDRAVVEASSTEVAIRRSSEPFFYQTNHVSSPALAKHQIAISPGLWIDSHERADRLAKLSQSGVTKGWATAEKLSALLGDKLPSRVAGGTIAKLDNIQTAILDPVHRRIWVALPGTDGKAPNENKYISYRWSDLRSPRAPEVSGSLSVHSPESTARQDLRALLRFAIEEQTRAPIDQALAPKLLSSLNEYAEKVKTMYEADTTSSKGTWAGLLLHGFATLKSSALDESARHSRLLEHGIALMDIVLDDKDLEISNEYSEHRKLVARLLRGRFLDLLGRRSEALFEYQVIDNHAQFERLKRAAHSSLLRPYTWDGAKKLAIDWAGIDAYMY